MFGSKYSNVLTMILVVFIVAILGIVGYFAYDLLNANKINSNAQAALQEFEKATQSVKKDTSNLSKNESKEDNTTVEDVDIGNLLNQLGNTATPPATEPEEPEEEYEKVYMEDYEIKGEIEIPKTNVNYPILDRVTKRSIEIAVAIAYPLGANLNEPGNVVIYGHNYRNGLFFSDNKKLSEGDKIYITDSVHKERVEYEIYKIYQAEENDASYFNRDTEGRREISLQTCTDDTSARIVILAAEVVK